MAPPTLDELPTEGGMPLRRPWSQSDRFVPRTFVRPAQRFLDQEAAGGIVMLVAAVIAIVWANSPFADSYEELWDAQVVIKFGGLIDLSDLHLHEWVNDGLMTFFFFVAALEMKREMTTGALSNRKAAALPAIAALGGMVMPALVYAAFNLGTDGASGFGIPMATDIAFAVGVVTLLGSRVPVGARLFLLTLAIVDDIGGIIVIAVFYAEDLSFTWLALAAAGVAVAWVMSRIDVRWMAAYACVGVFVWLALLQSGVHATIAGVALGLITPAWPHRSPRRFAPTARRMVDDIERSYAEGLTATEAEQNESTMEDIVRLAHESVSPLERIEHRLAPWAAYVIVPIFALANAGVVLSTKTMRDAATSTVGLGIFFGLIAGKTIGVSVATWLAVHLGIGTLPDGTTWGHVVGLAMTAGVGFTVALFVTELSFDAETLVSDAKIAILAASLVAGITGYLLLRLAATRAPRPTPSR
ncbi:MAG: Na+/H+ antiporter NhaA [Acidimicrobiales bacterium]|nr:Na+/H+ antiporter NhaA [Acidimicrobiales bacterium]